MGDEEVRSCGADGGGYTIFLDEQSITAFMEEGDFASARDLDHFKEIETQLEKKLKEGEGYSLLALSADDDRISRDFAILQISHLLAKHGKKVLIVDCDFIQPGLSGLVENTGNHGFLDLLLYGSSLKSVTRPTGIDGVSVTGAGSFPVSKTVPFALKEFGKVDSFLKKRCDIVIYCSTCYTEESILNPLSKLVDGLVLCCRIDNMEEGELQKITGEFGRDLPPADLICFCSGKEELAEPAGADRIAYKEEAGTSPAGSLKERAGGEEEEQPVYIEKTEELTPSPKRRRNGVNLPRLITIVFSSLVAIFIVWWFLINKSFREEVKRDRMSEVIEQQKEAAAKAGSGQEEVASRAAEEEADRSTAGGKEPKPVEVVTGNGGAVKMDERSSAADSLEGAGGAARADLPGGGASAPVVETMAPEGFHYSVHVASFKDISRAGTESDYLESLGYVTSIVEVDVKGTNWFRVMAGEYDSREKADEARAKLIALRRIAYARVVLVEEKQQ